MCEWGDTVILTINGRRIDVDRCISSLVQTLNENGFETVASCCGHENRPGNIALKDGRELIISPDYKTSRKIDKIFPDIHGEHHA